MGANVMKVQCFFFSLILCTHAVKDGGEFAKCTLAS